MDIQSTSRRNFFKQMITYTAVGVAVQTLARQAKAAALKLIDMKSKSPIVDTAKGIGYVENLAAALKAKSTTKTERVVGTKKFAPADQTCDTCMFFDMQKKGEDTCTLLPGVLVHKKGSCNSWAPKA
jgi:hypothetical protein